MLKYGIWCQVWGGVTGTRSSWMKHDGQRYETTNFEEAATLAKQLIKDRLNNPRATFLYTPMEINNGL